MGMKRQTARAVFLTVSAVIVIMTGMAPRIDRQDYTPLEPVTLFIATDLHYLSPELTDHGPFFQDLITDSDGKAMEYCEEITDAFVEQVIGGKPDALILSGDLTFNGEELSHTALAEKLRLVEDAGIPVLVLPGNHDLENPMSASFRGAGYNLTESTGVSRFKEIRNNSGACVSVRFTRES